MCSNIHTYIHIHTHIHTYIHTHIHTHTHTHAWKQGLAYIVLSPQHFICCKYNYLLVFLTSLSLMFLALLDEHTHTNTIVSSGHFLCVCQSCCLCVGHSLSSVTISSHPTRWCPSWTLPWLFSTTPPCTRHKAHHKVVKGLL